MSNLGFIPVSRLAKVLSSPSLMFFALPWLMVLLIMGTIAQRYIGLYASQKLFFGSFLLWVGIVPLPGAYATLAMIAASMTAKILFRSKFKKRFWGTLIVHMSAIVLLAGGLISTLGREDGYMILADGDRADSVFDYQKMELAISKNGTEVAAMPDGVLRTNGSVEEDALPFKVRMLRYCYPCIVRKREDKNPDLRDAAIGLELENTAPVEQEGRNLHGAMFVVEGARVPYDGIYLDYDTLKPAQLSIGKDEYVFTLRPAKRSLPFAIQLRHFTKSDYPGTDEARAYRSEVTVKDGALTWNTVIEMNQPLRYKGYTLYQSSFVKEGSNIASVLAVVRNAGDWFPYIAISMLCLGLLMHIGGMMHRGKSRN